MKTSGKIAGFTLVEAVMSIVIVAVMYVAALQTLGASRVSQATLADQRRGHELGRQLLAELMALPYADPSGGSTIGPNSGESGSTRANFDDIDDYDGWSEQPPALKDGTKLADLTDWSRRVSVVWIDPDNLDNQRSSETNLKRVTVQVNRGLKPVATIVALRAKVD